MRLLKLKGLNSINGDIDFSMRRGKKLEEPEEDDDVCTKAYADTH